MAIPIAELTEEQKNNLALLIAEGRQQNVQDLPLLLAQAWNESRFLSQAKSPVGAQGIMQLMPATAKEMGVNDPFDPQQNIAGGVKYHKQLNKQFGDPKKALAAYNWGMGNVRRFEAGEIPRMPTETEQYLEKIDRDRPEFESLLAKLDSPGEVAPVEVEQEPPGTVTPIEMPQDLPEEDKGLFQRAGELMRDFFVAPASAADRSPENETVINNAKSGRNVSTEQTEAIKPPGFGVQWAKNVNLLDKDPEEQDRLIKQFKSRILRPLFGKNKLVYPYVEEMFDSSLDAYISEAGKARLEGAVEAQDDQGVIENTARAFTSGFIKNISDPVRLVGLLTDSEGAQGAADAIDAIFDPADPEFASSFGGQVASGLGQVIGLMAGGVAGLGVKGLTKGATAALPKLINKAAVKAGAKGIPLVAAGSSGAVSQIQDYYEEAEKQGETIELPRKLLTATAGGMIGAADILLPTKMLGGFSVLGKLDDLVVKYIAANPRIAKVLASGTIEGTQEALQSAASEIAGAFIYDKDINAAEALRQAGEEGGVGSAVGAIVGLVVPGRGPSVKVDQATVDETKAKIFEREAEVSPTTEPPGTVTPFEVPQDLEPPTVEDPDRVVPPPAETLVQRAKAKAAFSIRRNLTSGGMFRAYQDLMKPARAGATRTGGGGREIIEQHAQQNRVGNVDVENDIFHMRDIAREYEQKVVPEADRELIDQAMRGDPDAYDSLPDYAREITDFKMGRMEDNRQGLINDFLIPLGESQYAQIHDITKDYLGGRQPKSMTELESFIKEDMANAEEAKDNPLTPPERVAEAEALLESEADLYAAIQDQRTLLRNWTGNNHRLTQFSARVEGVRNEAGDIEIEPYVHGTYRIFTEPEFRKEKKADKEGQAEVALLLGQAAQRHGVEGTLGLDTPEKLRNFGMEKVQEWLSDTPTQVDIMSATEPVTALLRRKDIDSRVKEWMGAEKDPFINYASTQSQINRIRTNAQFANNFLELGMQENWMHRNPQPGGQYEQLSVPGNKGFDVLDGVWVPKDMHQGFNDFFKDSDTSDWMRQWMRLNYAIKWGLTVGSSETTVRNYGSNAIFGLATGSLNPIKYYKAIRALAPMLTKSGKIPALVREAIKLGVVGESARGATFEAMLEDIGKENDFAAALRDVGTTAKGVKGAGARLKAFKRLMDRIYVYGDDVGKLGAFAIEIDRRAKARGKDPNDPEVRKEAADIIKNTWVTYSRTPRAVQRLRRIPFGTFPAFPAEVVRTANEMRKQAVKDLKDPNPAVKRLGAYRVASMTAATALTPLMIEGARRAAGISEEEHEALCKTLNFWQNCSSVLWLGQDPDTGEHRILDMKSVNPYLYLTDVPAMLMSDKNADTAEAMARTASELFSPFGSPDILPKLMYEAVSNPGGRVYDKTDSGPVQAAKMAKHVGTGFIPRTLKRAFIDIPNAMTGTRDWRGKKRKVSDVIKNTAGYGVQTHSPTDALTWAPWEYMAVRRSVSGNITEAWQGENRTNPNADLENLIQVHTEQNARLQEVWAENQKIVQAVRDLGYENDEILEAMNPRKPGGIGIKRANRLLNGYPADPVKIEKKQISKYIKKLKSFRPRPSDEEIREIEVKLYALQKQFDLSE